MKIEVGKYYKLGNGDKVYIAGTLPPVLGCRVYKYIATSTKFSETARIDLFSEKGTNSSFQMDPESIFHIVEEWKEPLTQSRFLVLMRNENEIACITWKTIPEAERYAANHGLTILAIKEVSITEGEWRDTV